MTPAKPTAPPVVRRQEGWQRMYANAITVEVGEWDVCLRLGCYESGQVGPAIAELALVYLSKAHAERLRDLLAQILPREPEAVPPAVEIHS